MLCLSLCVAPSKCALRISIEHSLGMSTLLVLCIMCRFASLLSALLQPFTIKSAVRENLASMRWRSAARFA